MPSSNLLPPRSRHRRLLVGGLLIAGAVSLVMGAAADAWMRERGLTLAEAYDELRRGDEPRFEWRSVDGKHWQATAGVSDTMTPVDAGALEQTDSAGCPGGMTRVRGAYRAGQGPGSTEVERLQDSACVEWLNRDFPARCNVFDPEKIAHGLVDIQTRPIDVCIDRFEYPNVAGQNPIIVVTFREAESICKGAGKRLCSEDEWTFACEGEEAWPYPYGFKRDPSACVVDRSWRPFTEGALSPRDGRGAREELDRLWQGEPSGARPACKSPFGVYDLAGNVDEWTRSTQSQGFASILKGGYWGPVRARCRPSTRAHGEDFIAYQQSFRCCAAPSLAAPEPAANLTADASVVEDGGAEPVEPDDEAAVAPEQSSISLSREVDSTTDELAALARTRAKFRCDVAGAPAHGASNDGFALLFFACVALAWRGRRAR